jgi:hypothetical protein
MDVWCGGYGGLVAMQYGIGSSPFQVKWRGASSQL